MYNNIINCCFQVGRAGKETEEAAKKVNDLLGDVESIVLELQNLPNIDNVELDKLEQELRKAEQRVAEAKLDERLSELQAQQKNQNDLVNFYKNEIARLQKEVDNVEQIARALPDGCFKQVELEP